MGFLSSRSGFPRLVILTVSKGGLLLKVKNEITSIGNT